MPDCESKELSGTVRKGCCRWQKIESVDAYYESLYSPLKEVAEKLGAVIDAAIPETPHAMWHGSPVWSAGATPGKQPVALIKAYPRYITFGLWRGREINDASGKIDTSGSMAGLKFASLGEIDEAQLTDWLHQALALEQP